MRQCKLFEIAARILGEIVVRQGLGDLRIDRGRALQSCGDEHMRCGLKNCARSLFFISSADTTAAGNDLLQDGNSLLVFVRYHELLGDHDLERCSLVLIC